MTQSLSRVQCTLESPIGLLRLVAHEQGLVGIYMPQHKGAPPACDTDDPEHRVLVAACAQLQAYFAGQRQAFDLPLAPVGTPFQREVWAALQTIPYGETVSYGDIAKRLGRPKASRAVGAANGRNPISIIIPCHRVVGANGALTGYAGGEASKQWLLQHEGALPPAATPHAATGPSMSLPLFS